MNYTIGKETIKSFEQKLIEDEKSKNTIDKYIRDVRVFVEYLGNKELTKSRVLEYKSYLAERYAIASVNSMLASINSFFSYIEKIDLCVKHFKLQREIFCAEKRELTKEEYFRLVNAAKKKGNERLYLILQTICGTGMRVSELRYVTVEAVRSGEVSVRCKGKTRTVLIVKRLRSILLKYAKRKGLTCGCLFITAKGKPVARTSIWRDMKSLCKQANVSSDKVFPHNLRHLFARVFYGLEKDIAKLADILGHSSINTTRIYIVTTSAAHRRKMENMHLVI